MAVTAWRLRVLLLGSIYRQVIVDPQQKIVSIFARYFWFFPSRQRIPFSRVQAVTYGYEDMGFRTIFSLTHDGFDFFSVGLRLIDDTEVPLFYFVGDGNFTNDSDLPDWVFWEEMLLDLSGSQTKESRVFVDVLSKLFDVTVVPPRRS